MAMLVEPPLHCETWNFSGWARGRQAVTRPTRHQRGVSVRGQHHAPSPQCGALLSRTRVARAGGLFARSMPPHLRCCLLVSQPTSTRLRRALHLAVSFLFSALQSAEHRRSVHEWSTAPNGSSVVVRGSLREPARSGDSNGRYGVGSAAVIAVSGCCTTGSRWGAWHGAGTAERLLVVGNG